MRFFMVEFVEPKVSLIYHNFTRLRKICKLVS